MPLRINPTAWFNLPGVVAAYQPIGAPDSLLTRYNQAHGGDNRYRAEPGTLPGWSSRLGWTFNAGSSQYVKTGIIPNDNYSMIIRVANATTGGHGTYNYSTSKGFAIFPYVSGSYYYYAPNQINAIASTTDKLIGIVVGQAAYHNGQLVGTFSGTLSTQGNIFIGVNSNQNSDPVIGNYYTGNVFAVVIYSRKLSNADMYYASRQMAYCHVNPDWSAWGRRRKWFYAPVVAATEYTQGVSGAGTPAGAVVRQTGKRVGAF